jgi:hypothetical protein
LAVKAFVVNRPPILIGLDGFELHGFLANAASWGRGLEMIEVSGMMGMNWSPVANHQIAQETEAKGNGGGRMCKTTSKSV